MSNQYRSVLAGAAGTGGDAVAADVLSGKTFTNDYGPQTGSMTNNGAVTQTLAAGASYTIPEGYHDGHGTVSASAYSNCTPIRMLASGQSVELTGVNVGDMILVIRQASSSTTSFVTASTGLTSLGYAELQLGAGGDYETVEALIATANNPSITARTTGVAAFKIG